MRTRLKVCCIASVEEAQTAVRHGADALGLVSATPSGPGVIGEDRIAEGRLDEAKLRAFVAALRAA